MDKAKNDWIKAFKNVYGDFPTAADGIWWEDGYKAAGKRIIELEQELEQFRNGIDVELLQILIREHKALAAANPERSWERRFHQSTAEELRLRAAMGENK